MARVELTVGGTQVCAQALLIGEVGFDGIGDEEVGTPTGLASKVGETLFGGGLEANTERGIVCVCHEHIMARAASREKAGGYKGPRPQTQEPIGRSAFPGNPRLFGGGFFGVSGG